LRWITDEAGHDTANAVATVIYTNSMPANYAVVWSGFFNFLGVLLSSGAVAFGIVSLLPVELILQVALAWKECARPGLNRDQVVCRSVEFVPERRAGPAQKARATRKREATGG